MGSKTCPQCGGSGNPMKSGIQPGASGGGCPTCGGKGWVYDNNSGGGGGGECFASTTKILTPNGNVPISDISAGNIVSSYDASINLMTHREVLRVKEHIYPVRIWHVHLFGKKEPIQTTKNHTILSDKGWSTVKKFKNNDVIIAIDLHGEKTIERVDCVIRTESFLPTYNLITQGECNYIADGVVAHSFTYFRNFRRFLCNTSYAIGSERGDTLGIVT